MNYQSKAVGMPVSRLDGPLKVTGTAKYAAEHFEPDMVQGYAVLSTIAKGRLIAIGTTEARKQLGVIAIYTHENRPKAASRDSKWQDTAAPPGSPFRPLESDQIQFDGQPIALVVADTFEHARDAAALIVATYDVAEPHTDLGKEYVNSYEPPKKRSGIPPAPKPRGDAEGAYSKAAFKISSDFSIPGEHHNAMELFASTVLWEAEGQLTIHDKTQGPQASRDYVCSVFGLRPENVKVKNAFVGGAFGSALRPKYQLFLAVMASLDLKRSIKIEMTRQEMFYLTWRPTTIQTVPLAADEDGLLQSVMHHAVQATSTYEDYQEVVVNWSGLAYKCDNTKLTYEIAKLDLSTPGDMRAPGAATGVAALEVAMDELAYEVGIDPLQLRVRNFVHRDQDNDKQLTSKALHSCYREGAKAFGWEKRISKPRSMQEGNDLVGWGMATGFWDAMLMAAEAEVRYAADGGITVSAAASDIGTGTYTIFAQLAADEFDVPVDRVSVLIGDSTLPTTGLAGGSWTAASSGSAIHLACIAVRKTLLGYAQSMEQSPLAKASVEDVCIRDGRLVLDTNNQVGVSLSDVLESKQLSSVAEIGKAGPNLLQMMTFKSYTHSAVFVEVRIDEELGVLRVTRVVSAIAAGRILNPKTARSQILGGVVMALGMALHEEGMIDHRSGRIINHNLAEYHIPAHADIEEINVIFVDEHDDKISPIGVKGLGEIGLVGVAAAVSNAVFHATGKRIRDFPITIDKIILEKDAMR
jgi:xanthine dehydrogenase YagR molybdenum-binding subunit